MNTDIPFSQACERNKDIILKTIKPYLNEITRVLEIGTGTAQHAIHFSQELHHIQWQTSDQPEYLKDIHVALDNAKEINLSLGKKILENILDPIELNVNQQVWNKNGELYDAIYTANTLHIMNKSDVEQFFSGLSNVIKPRGSVIVYGPFKYNEKFTSESNAEFDITLRSRDVGSAIRDFEWVNALAQNQDFKLIADHAMPANNQCLVWQKAN